MWKGRLRKPAMCKSRVGLWQTARQWQKRGAGEAVLFGMAPPLEEARDVASCQDWASSDWNERNVVTGTWTWDSQVSGEIDQGWSQTHCKFCSPLWPWISSFLIHQEHLPIFLIKVHTGIWPGGATVFCHLLSWAPWTDCDGGSFYARHLTAWNTAATSDLRSGEKYGEGEREPLKWKTDLGFQMRKGCKNNLKCSILGGRGRES